MPIFIPNIQGKWCIKRKEREYRNVYYERGKGSTKSEIKERRKNKYKSYKYIYI